MKTWCVSKIAVPSLKRIVPGLVMVFKDAKFRRTGLLRTDELGLKYSAAVMAEFQDQSDHGGV